MATARQPAPKRPPVTRMVPSQRPRDLPPPYDPLSVDWPVAPQVTLTRGRPPQQGPLPYFMRPTRPDVVIRG